MQPLKYAVLRLPAVLHVPKAVTLSRIYRFQERSPKGCVDSAVTYNIYTYMHEPDEKPKRPTKAEPEHRARRSAEVVSIRRPFPPAKQPDRLNDADALKLIRMLAGDSNNIVVIKHAQKRRVQRNITRPQIERCIQKGTITEGPFVNAQGNWQVNLSRFTAGEQITCVVAIDWPARLIVVTTF
ncbi:DUF4258 domain-containing protein [Bradyrhizobium sp. 521_C7_N1_3]|uniref:DUF4258 domain-containing protein n=1 Tax=Bradyrhizobium sp. 521_C7_N1_3 TaxID=3240368 RepID=UPI003F8BC476